MLNKQCKKCGCTEYYKDGKCKDCVKKRVSSYQEKNKEKVGEWKKNYKNKNKEKIKNSTKEYYEKNKEKISKYHRDRKINDENIRINLSKYKKDWKEKNKDKVLVQQHNRRSAIRKTKGRLSKDIFQILFQKQDGKCVYCSVSLEDVTVHIDHIMPIALGGSNTDDNVQLTCARCNYKKHYKHPDKFREMIKNCDVLLS